MARCFRNALPDYVAGGVVTVNKDLLKQRVVEYVKLMTSQLAPSTSRSACDGGLYVGTAGIAYLLYYLSRSPHFTAERQSYLTLAEKYISACLTYARAAAQRDVYDSAAFILGGGGVSVVAAAIYGELGEGEAASQWRQAYAQAAQLCLPTSYLQHGCDEMLVGRAGYLCGLLWLRREAKQEIVPQDTVNKLLDAMIKSGVEYSARHKSPCPLMYAYHNTEYIGAGHGIAGILLTILSFPDYLKSNKKSAALVKESIDFVLSLEQADGNYAPAMDEVGHPRSSSDELVHWCHGAPGVVYLLAKAYLHYKEAKYLEACKRCAELTWTKGLLRKGVSICHGVAGSGYVFLLLYRLTSQPLYLHRAQQFADFLFTSEFERGSRRPDSPYSLYEGVAGTTCFLHDLLAPDHAHFPFMDVY